MEFLINFFIPKMTTPPDILVELFLTSIGRPLKLDLIEKQEDFGKNIHDNFE